MKRLPDRDFDSEWLGRLFETLYPLAPALGSLPNLDTSFPEYRSVLPILKTWLEERLNRLDPSVTRTARYFLGDVVSMSLLAYSLDHNRACQYGPRTTAATMKLPALIHRSSDQAEPRTIVDEALIWFTGKESYSLTVGALFARLVLLSLRPAVLSDPLHQSGMSPTLRPS